MVVEAMTDGGVLVGVPRPMAQRVIANNVMVSVGTELGNINFFCVRFRSGSCRESSVLFLSSPLLLSLPPFLPLPSSPSLSLSLL